MFVQFMLTWAFSTKVQWCNKCELPNTKAII